MTTQTEALKLALEYINEYYPSYAKQAAHHHRVNTAIKEALANHIVDATKMVAQQECQSNYCLQCEALSRELAALKAQQSNEQVEPKAWISWNRVSGESKLNYHKVISHHDANLWQHFPLYTHPPVPAAQPKGPEQEPVAVDGNTSDGYHTFNELYDFRKAYNAALFNEWSAGKKCSVHKSWRHHNGELCFGGGWFIVVAVLPDGQISNHYEAKDWDLFSVPETERALFEFDGHTGANVIHRLKAYTTQQRTWVGLTEEEVIDLWPDLIMHKHTYQFWQNLEAKLKEKNT